MGLIRDLWGRIQFLHCICTGIIGVIRLFTGFNGLLVVELSKGCRRLLKLLKPSRVSRDVWSYCSMFGLKDPGPKPNNCLNNEALLGSARWAIIDGAGVCD